MKNVCNVLLFFTFYPLMAWASPTDVGNGGSVLVFESKDTNEIKIKGERQASEHVAKSIIATYCADKDTLHFKVGRQRFAAKRERTELTRSVVKTLGFSYYKDTRETEWTVPANLGCKDNPAAFSSIGVMDGMSSSMVLTESQDSVSVLAYIEHLNRNKMCQATKHAYVVACTGSRTEQGAKVIVIFMLPITPSGVFYIGTSNVPVHARCETKSPPDFSCRVNEYFEQNFKATFGIESDAPSKDVIIRAREIILNETRKLMVDSRD